MKTWLTVTEGAEYARVSRDTIYTACERRELRHARVAGRRAIRLKREWIDAWLEQYTCGAPPAAHAGVDAPPLSGTTVERQTATTGMVGPVRALASRGRS